MNFAQFGDTYILRLDKGEEIVRQLYDFATREDIKLARVSAIGATDNAVVGAFNTASSQYCSHQYLQMMEILSIEGNITVMDNAPYLHLHITLATEDGRCVGGHLNSAVVSATAEVTINCIHGVVDRAYDQATGLNFIKV